MSELTEKITIQESNLANATKREYYYQLRQFYAFVPVKTDDFKPVHSESCGNVL